ncbi:AEC family transporter [Anaeroselena agilis]|uniref:Transporter n=1 Tax=Anaeroselena agilis TaxID=3063788 RepID=A0ABU3P210_9FIRM|nr:transporter [Selenomonadales bacterium 4137-cl]
MDIGSKIIYFFFDLLLPLAVGYMCRRQTKFDDEFFQRMMTWGIMFVYPVLAFLGFWATRLDAELIWLPVLGVVLSVIPGALAFFRAKAKYASSLDQGSYVMSAMMSNTLTLGGVSAFIIYGETGFAYVQLITLLATLYLFLFCFPLAGWYAQGGRWGGAGISVASVIFSRNQLPALGLLVGAWLYYSGIPRPAWAGAVFDPLVHIGAWMQLIPVGYSVDFREMRQYWLSILDLNIIKFVITPVLSYAIGSLVLSDPVAVNTLLITASTPTAILSVVAVKLHRLNVHITMASFVLTTAVYLLVVYPLQFLWLSGRL